MQTVRIGLRVTGRVQGVGFRPFVFRLASGLGLSGRVWNDAAGVRIEVQGARGTVERFRHGLGHDAPPQARIGRIRQWPLQAGAEAPFAIAASGGGAARTAVTPDIATCDDCLRELRDPSDRRHGYPFTNCTQCGPRYTITDRLPYDRPHTAMARFALCPACAAEYADPGDRRFHAQPNACPECGPRLTLVGRDRRVLDADALAGCARRLQQGAIVALKGLGGFHLACDARDAAAVERLRLRKGREAKPFAVMAADPAALHEVARIDADASRLLESAERPIVLLPKRDSTDAALPGVAPGVACLGGMLPATPLHHLLFDALLQTAPARTPLLVMTSANPGGEPLVTGNREAHERLGDIADALLLHDRPVRVRCDDSVVRPVAGGFAFLRRARGHVPAPIRLPSSGPSVLAFGGDLKNTVCVTRGDEAFVSQHIGDLDNGATCRALGETVEHLCRVLDIRPERVVHDAHPGYRSAAMARDHAARRGLPLRAVYHHAAHVAAVAAEHGLRRPLLGLALDGTGYGGDDTVRGGELLRLDGPTARRIAALAPLRLPGGDVAAREPWRMAAAALHALGRGDEIVARFADHAAAPAVRQMLDRGLRCPPVRSGGRLFDAAAGLLGIQPVSAFEGQAAMRLEALAGGVVAAPDPDGFRITEDGSLDLLPLLDRLAGPGVEPGQGAALFHETLAEGLCRWIADAAHRAGLQDVVLGGGCLLNARLSARLGERLRDAGLRVFEARQVPAGDGGLSLGQAWLAMQLPFGGD